MVGVVCCVGWSRLVWGVNFGIAWFVCLPVFTCLCLDLIVCMSVSLPAHLFFWLAVCLSVCLSVRVDLCQGCGRRHKQAEASSNYAREGRGVIHPPSIRMFCPKYFIMLTLHHGAPTSSPAPPAQGCSRKFRSTRGSTGSPKQAHVRISKPCKAQRC